MIPLYKDHRFKIFIRSMLRLGRIKEDYIIKITNNKGMKLYQQAFTHPTADPVNNYEILEFLGDSTVNKFIVWYLYRRFPELNNIEGISSLTRIANRLKSKKSFAFIALHMKREHCINMWYFVQANTQIKTTDRNKTLEDVFEAFFGATEMLLDRRFCRGVGACICYTILESIFNEIAISLEHNLVIDSITQAKEFFETPEGNEMGSLVYSTIRRHNGKYYVKAVIKPNGGKYRINEIYQSFFNDKDPHLCKQIIKYSLEHPQMVQEILTICKTNYDRALPEQTLGKGEAYTKKDAVEKASKQVINYLQSSKLLS